MNFTKEELTTIRTVLNHVWINEIADEGKTSWSPREQSLINSALDKATQIKPKYYVFGMKWFDKENGNTYNNALIYDDEMNLIGKTGFEYGYEKDYITRARKWLCNNVTIRAELYDMGESYFSRAKCIKGDRD